MRCEDFELIASDFLNDGLAIEEKRSADEHASACNRCKKHLETIIQERQALFPPVGQISKNFERDLFSKIIERKNSTSGFYKIAASLIIGVIAGYAYSSITMEPKIIERVKVEYVKVEPPKEMKISNSHFTPEIEDIIKKYDDRKLRAINQHLWERSVEIAYKNRIQ